nr:hypothetical protein [Tanacetum cinerariifolium]
MPPKHDLVFNIALTAVETDHSAFTIQFSPTKPDQDLSYTNRPTAPIIKDWHVETSIPAATPKSASPKSASCGKRRHRNSCFVCKSVDHLIKYFDYHAKKMAQPTPRYHAHRGYARKMGMETKIPNSRPCFPKHKCINDPKKGNPQHALKDKGVIDSGCLRYMTGNMSYLFDFEELNGGYVAFGGNPKNNDGDAAFDGKEPDFDAKKPGINEVNATGTIVPTVGQNSLNSTNTLSAAGPLNAASSPTYGKSLFIDASQLPDDPDMPELEDITYYDDEDDVGAEADFNNLETSITVGPIPTTRVHKDHHVSQITGHLSSTTQTRSMTRVEEPKRVHQPLKDPSWIEAMQEELLQFKMKKL